MLDGGGDGLNDVLGGVGLAGMLGGAGLIGPCGMIGGWGGWLYVSSSLRLRRFHISRKKASKTATMSAIANISHQLIPATVSSGPLPVMPLFEVLLGCVVVDVLPLLSVVVVLLSVPVVPVLLPDVPVEPELVELEPPPVCVVVVGQLL